MIKTTRFLASLISAALIFVSPGQAWAAVVGQNVRVNTGGVNTGGVPAIKLGANGFQPLPLNTLTGTGFKIAPGLQISPKLQVNGQAVLEQGAVVEGAVLNGEAAVNVAAGQAASALTVGKIGGMAEQTGAVIETFNGSNRSDSGASHKSGVELQNILTGAKAKFADGVFTGGGFESAFGEGNGPGNFLAKPAGKDIQTSIDSQDDGGSNTPPPANNDGNGGGNNGDGSPKTPLYAKIIAVGIAFIPAAVIGWPLVAAGSFVYAGLLAAGSAALASMVLLSDRSSPAVRALPGYAIGALGLVSLATLIGGFSWLTLSLGAVVTVAGWGFTRFAKKELKDRSLESGEVIAAFFGALAAITGAGIVLLTPAGWVATGFTVLSFGSALLFRYLPGWVGRGIDTVARNEMTIWAGAYKTMTSLKRDTSMLKRLEKFTEAAIDEKPWNAIWVGLLLWVPVLALELVQLALTAVLAVGLGIAQAPLMFVAGATESAYWNGVAKSVFDWSQGSKTGWFNKWEALFIPTINGGNAVTRVLASLAVRAGQWGWFVSAAVAGTFGQLVALFKPTPGERSLPADPLEGKIPEIPAYKIGSAVPGKILATLIGLAPLYFFGGVLLAGGPLGWLVLGFTGLTALMPFTPWGGRAASTLMTVAGGWTLFESIRFLALAGLPTYWLIGAGAVAFLAGFGLANMIKKLRNKETKAYDLNEPEYILGYAGAVGVGLGVMVALSGLTSPLGIGLMLGGSLLSLALLYHLPAWLWRGVWGVIAGLFKPMGSVPDVSQKVWSDTKAHEAIGDFYKARFKGAHWTTAVVLGLIFAIPALITHAILPLVEWAVGLALGLAVGAARTPVNYFVWAKDSDWSKRYYKRLQDIQEKAKFEGGSLSAVWWLLKLAVLTAVSPLVWAYAAFTVPSNTVK